MSSMMTRKRKLVESPMTMVHKSGQNLVVKSVVSGHRIFGKEYPENGEDGSDDDRVAEDGGMSDTELWLEETAIDMGLEAPPEDPSLLPDCRVKRNYSCSQCPFFTQNPRKFLYHSRDDHAEKMKIYECKWCIYASKHSQKVLRHIKMCHGPDSATGKTAKTRLSKSLPTESSANSILQLQPKEEKFVCNDALGNSPTVDTEHSGGVSVRSYNDEEEMDDDEGCMSNDEGKEGGETHDERDDSVLSQYVQAEIDEDQEDDDGEEEDANYESGFIPNDAEMSGDEHIEGQRKPQGNKRRRGSTSGNKGKKFFKCKTCQYCTNVKARFTKHVKYHSMPLIKCDYCDFKTPYKWNLDRHYKNHNGEGNLHCPLCNFTADIKQSLTVHVQNHHANIPATSINDMIKQQIQLAAANEVKESIVPFAGMEAPYLNDSGEIMSEETVRKAKGKITFRKGIPKEAQGNDGLDLDSDLIPSDDILDKNGKIYIKKLKCQYCNYKAVWETEMNRHMTRSHGVTVPKKRNSTNASPSKPMPNLIPIQSPPLVNTGILSTICSSSKKAQDSGQRIGKPPSMKKEVLGNNAQYIISHSSNDGLKQANDTGKAEPGDFHDKSLFLQSLALKPNVMYSIDSENESMGRAASGSRRTSCSSGGSGRQLSTCGVDSSVSIIPILGSSSKPQATSTVVKSNAFFEELSQNLVANNGSTPLDMSKNSLTITSNSTRCQFCRQLCKTSTDLLIHLSNCVEAKRESEDSNNSDVEDDYSNYGEADALETNEGGEQEDQSIESGGNGFMWNESTANENDDDDDEESKDYDTSGHFLEGGDEDLVGFETAPGIGAIHSGKLEELWGTDGFSPVSMVFNNSEELDSITTNRKVYRCPQDNCGFWATTASRFHVHIVGHFNTKPFECSQCSYKSNWRWDITKHIKLKGMRDPEHHKAKVLLTHESGQRNYRKYDRYLQMMQLKHSADSKLPDCSTVASKRNDVETEVSPSSNVSAPKISPQTNNSAIIVPKLQMPKLTRAPSAQGAASPTNSIKSEEGSSRPPPPPALKPITAAGGRTIVEKRMLSGGQILSADDNAKPSQGSSVQKRQDGHSPAKKPRLGSNNNKKALWKCKKCTFKHASKEIVVFHIRQYHKPRKGESVSILKKNNLTSVTVDDDVEVELSEEEMSKSSFAKETHQYVFSDEDNLFSCKFCPFTTSTISSMETHGENHFSKPNCNFSCDYCSYSVPTKQELMDHMKLHGVFESESESPSLDKHSTITSEETPPKPKGHSASGSPYKKYHCTECPYVTDSKGQFIYHKQFHRPRQTPFKCPQCSYNVSHKHLLHQHIRVHGEIPGNTVIDDEPSDRPTPPGSPTSNSHPSCLVWRGGRPFRVYRCRVCPQVFENVDDLVEHEVTHGVSPITISQSQGEKSNNASIIRNINNVTVSPVSSNNSSQEKSALYLCEDCPARFFFEKELLIHHSFHKQRSTYRCQLCSYSARQETPHLLSHMKVHGREYQLKTEQLLQRYPKAPKLNFGGSISISVATNSQKRTQSAGSAKTSATISSLQQLQKLKGCTTNLILCQKCPGKFNSVVAYQQHVALHGVTSVYRCRYCDYSVETLKSLTLHELLHAGSEITVNEPINLQKKAKEIPISAPVNSHEPLDDDAYTGNPDFIYPTYVKNGRVKSKRYKCIKCPSAFEKRDQYKVHMGLHGSSQRYKCGVCDYAVTYYANFIQHLKKHSTQPNIPPELLIAKPLSKCKSEGTVSAHINPQHQSSSTNPSNSTLKCPKCSFTTSERSALDDHKLAHNLSATEAKDKKGLHKCSFCDFACSRKNLLKDHVRLHFHSSLGSESLAIYDDNVKISNEKENSADKKVKTSLESNQRIFRNNKITLPEAVPEIKEEVSESEVEENEEDSS